MAPTKKPEIGLRERKKARTRQDIADAAAALFAEHGYDHVTMLDVARAADVSDQTVYNYFAAKQDLVLDLAELFRDLYRDAVLQRGVGISPARALRSLMREDIERYRACDPRVAKGQFIAQSVESAVLRRFTLEERERQTLVIADSIVETTPELPDIVAHAHAAAIVAVIQSIHDRIGANVLNQSLQEEEADEMLTLLDVAIVSLDQTFAVLLKNAGTQSR